MQPIIKSSRVHVQERARRAGGDASGAAGAAAHGKHARLVSVGGEVRAIEFRCDCGETSLIELEFPTSEAPREIES